MFDQNDFKKFATQLQVIIMAELNHNVMSDFRNFSIKEKRIFNEHLNKYIQSLPQDAEDFELIITQDFHRVCNEELFPNMNKLNLMVRESTQQELEDDGVVELVLKKEIN
jgi:hypothetical protein